MWFEVVFIGCISSYILYWNRGTTENRPFQTLNSLSQTTPVQYELERIENLPVVEFNIMSHADCSTATDWETLQDLVRRKHEGRIPTDLLEDILPRIFVPGTLRNTDAYIDTKSSTEEKGLAYAHYVWFDLEVLETKLHLCLTISVLEVRTSEVLSEWIEEQHPEVTGYMTECVLGSWIWCRQTPLTTMTTKRFPVYRHIKLSMEQQEYLQQYLVHKAMSAAKAITHVAT